MQSKTVFRICEGISCSFYVKEFDAIVHKKVFFLYNPIKFLDIMYQITSETGGWGGN